ncbi:transcriptional regulator, ArsR family [Shimia gijangensis]|uniref:Transcriptional regulator, ArsR family n=1 Tax=Shimia gijangensis TaxID=1470563 RepID=A0A1M6Q371_9RHOB|nr:metalloregulator ArsR/SmtB family transcription factor [Shimia gijangensis]SHK14695.1 transcriptional regulator, ArsR family [Shimia gijangensis]
MDKINALTAFSALSQEIRLDVFRLLIEAGDVGAQAGEIATQLNVRQNTLSANLSVLLNAGLVTNQREGRAIRYFANTNGLRGLLGFLLKDCCGGHPELCEPLIETLTCRPEGDAT